MVCVLPAVPQLLALEVLPLGGVLAGPQALRPNRQRHKREHVLRTNLGRDFGFQVVLTYSIQIDLFCQGWVLCTRSMVM